MTDQLVENATHKVLSITPSTLALADAVGITPKAFAEALSNDHSDYICLMVQAMVTIAKNEAKKVSKV